MGRLLVDVASVAGGGGGIIDDGVRKLKYAYDSLGRRTEFVSVGVNDQGQDKVINAVRRQYNGFGQVVAEWQDHDSNIGPGDVPTVTYEYVMERGASVLRCTNYPLGKSINYAYEASMARLASISYGNSEYIERYSYIGLDKVVNKTRVDSSTDNQPDMYLTYDPFGRVERIEWKHGGARVNGYSYNYGRAAGVESFSTLETPGG